MIAVALSVLSLHAMLFNSVGLYVLSKPEFRRTNQWLIIKGISIINIAVAIGWLLRDAESVIGFKYPGTILNVVMAVNIGAYCTRYLNIFLLTIDRFLCANFPVRYRVLSSKYKIVILSTWGIGFAIITINSLTKHDRWRGIFERYVWLLLDLVFLAIFVTTYSTIYCRNLKNSIGTTQSNASIGRNRFKRMVTFVLVAFLFFQVFPDISLTILYGVMKIKERLLLSGFLLLYRLNMFIDPFIYILLHPSARQVLTRMMRRIFAGNKVHDLSQLQQRTVSNSNEE